MKKDNDVNVVWAFACGYMTALRRGGGRCLYLAYVEKQNLYIDVQSHRDRRLQWDHFSSHLRIPLKVLFP